jgi:hypothetical protein
MAFDAKVQEKIDFETLQAKRDPGLPPIPVREGSILNLTDSEKSKWASSLNFVKIRKYDKDYSSEYICFPLVKGTHEANSLNHKTDSPCMKHPGIDEDSPWKKCSNELTWQTEDTRMECSR